MDDDDLQPSQPVFLAAFLVNLTAGMQCGELGLPSLSFDAMCLSQVVPCMLGALQRIALAANITQPRWMSSRNLGRCLVAVFPD
jgi:hypothetical protein